ncbi:MAG: PilZ domain-containing protein [Proteobacteria bacterium]|nr:PilZ domain-containing protein [Cystobacterineae bacterium]MCL2259436.1 PilZ domain-containing protein [Cystobacterineae bacterium]MCL2314423.1 PilZ domain-containing protein [Pseudomonadota bacterium]
MSDDERRKFRRVRAPVFCRPTGPLASIRYETKDIGIGGIRVLSDEKHKVGQHIDIELLLPSQEFLSLTAKVVWVSKGQAGWETGLSFVDVSPMDLKLLEPILESEGTDKTIKAPRVI